MKEGKSELKIVNSMLEVNQLIDACKTMKTASVDFETTGLEYFNGEQYLLTLGVSFQPGSSWVIPLGHKDSPFKKHWEKIFIKFSKEVIENYEICKWAWNLKFEYKWFYRYGIKMKGRIFDAMIMKYCLDEERPHGLKEFVQNFFPQFAGYANDIKNEEDNKKFSWKEVDLEKLCKYNGLDADLTLRAGIYLESRLIKMGFYSLFRNLLMPSVRLLAEAEIRGTLIDTKYLKGLIDEYRVKIFDADKEMREIHIVRKFDRRFKRNHLKELINKVKLEIEEIENSDANNKDRLILNRQKKISNFLQGQFNKKDAYDKINFESPKQLVNFLFTSKNGLKLKPIKYSKTTKEPSTGKEILEKLEKVDKSGFIKRLLSFRKITKLNSTYIEGMNEILYHPTNRVHTNFLVHGTVTGRLSSRGPNLQNIPRGTTSKDIKRMFIPPPGYILFEVDYGQAELRVIAELSGDESLIEIFKKNRNVHVATACKMFKGDYDTIKGILKEADAMSAEDIAKPENKKFLKWAKHKKIGKSMNFSILYLQGDKATAEQMSITEDKAKEFKVEWFESYPRIKPWIKKQIKFAKKHEYVKTPFGRKRRLPDINGGDAFFGAESERQSVNFPMQSISNDFGLLGQLEIRDKIKSGILPIDMHEIYTVHDSIGFYIRPKDIHRIVPIIVKACENPETKKYFGFEFEKVKMKMSPEAGKNWADLHDYDAWTNYEKLLD